MDDQIESIDIKQENIVEQTVDLEIQKVSATEVKELKTITTITEETKSIEDYDAELAQLEQGISNNRDQITFLEAEVVKTKQRKADALARLK